MHENDENRLDIASPKLERFLGSAEERPFAPNERLRRIRAIFGEAMRRQQRQWALEELHPYRIMVLWRISRLTLEVKGRLADDERLADATEISPSPWEHPTRPVTPRVGAPVQRGTVQRGTGGLLARHVEGEGLPLICPERKGSHDHEETIKLVERWCDAVGIAAGILGVGDTERGQKGLQGLLDPELASWCCPTPEQVLAFEEQLISEAVDLLIEHGEPATMQHYRTAHGLTRREALSIVRMSRARIKEDMMIPVEEARSILLARYERFLYDIAQTPNMRDRLLALKEVARITGVTRQAPEDVVREFLGVVRSVSAKREDTELQRGKIIEALPAWDKLADSGDKPADAAFEVFEDDRSDDEDEDSEALDAYDRENK